MQFSPFILSCNYYQNKTGFR